MDDDFYEDFTENENIPMESTNATLCVFNNNVTDVYVSREHTAWIVIDFAIIILIVFGNIMTICAIKLSKKISELLSNRYIFNLAISDLMVGLTIPYHMSFNVWSTLGQQKSTCLIRFVLVIMVCCSSIYNLLAIATDRYIAIVFPFHYSRHMSKGIVWTVIAAGWLISILVATAPIYWNTWDERCYCSFVAVLPNMYANLILTPMFLSIWLVMFLLYIRIWRETKEHTKRFKFTTQFQHRNAPKILRENKSVQMVLLILGCFSICWLPYFIIITYMRYIKQTESNLVYELAFTMAVTNSCINPVIYAWKSRNYRKAFWCMLKCQSPRILNQEQNFITDHVPNQQKFKELQQLENVITTIEMRGDYAHENCSDATIITTCG